VTGTAAIARDQRAVDAAAHRRITVAAIVAVLCILFAVFRAPLAALVPLGYRPLAEWQGRGTWHDPVWTRAVEHGATFAALAIDRWWTSGIILKLGESSPRRW